jgi:hypothetical protein
MSLWEFMAAVEGYVKANSSEDEKTLTASEIDDLWEMVKDG